MSKLQQRKDNFKNSGLSAASSRDALRQKSGLNRKQNREATLITKRLRPSTTDGPPLIAPSASDMVAILERIKSSDKIAALENLRNLRKNLCSTSHSLDVIFNAGAIAVFCEMLCEPNEELRLEAVWCLTNIATGDHAQTGLVLPAAPNMIQLLSSDTTSGALRDQICWAIGNIAGDSDEYRQILLDNGVLSAIVSFVIESSGEMNEWAQTAAWALSNLARGSISGINFATHDKMSVLVQILSTTRNDTLATELCWLFAFLTAKELDAVDLLLSSNLVPALSSAAERFQSLCSTTLPIPLLRCIGNLSAGPSRWADLILAHSAFIHILCTLSATGSNQSHRAVRKESLWALGNLLAVSDAHRTTVLGYSFTQTDTVLITGSAVLDNILSAVLGEGYDIQREGVFALENASASNSTGTGDGMIHTVLKMVIFDFPGVVEQSSNVYALRSTTELLLNRLCQMIKLQTDSELTCACIRLLSSFMDISSAVMDICVRIELADVLDHLQYAATDPIIGQMAGNLVEKLYAFMEAIDIDAGPVTTVDTESIGGICTIGQETSRYIGQESSNIPLSEVVPPVGRGRGSHLNIPSWMKNG